MSKISDMPVATVLEDTHIVQVVDTALADADKNQHMTIPVLVDNLGSASYLFDGQTTLTLSPVETQIVAWTTAIATGQSTITPATGGSFTVTEAGIYELEANIVIENILVGNDNDNALAASINGGPGIAFATAYYVGTGGGSSQLLMSFSGSIFLDLAASDAVTLTLTTTGAGNVTFDSRHAIMRKV